MKVLALRRHQPALSQYWHTLMVYNLLLITSGWIYWNFILAMIYFLAGRCIGLISAFTIANVKLYDSADILPFRRRSAW